MLNPDESIAGVLQVEPYNGFPRGGWPIRFANSILTPLIACAASSMALSAEVSATMDDDIRYGRDVRPILSDRCFSCHGPDAEARQADLRLDDRVSATSSRENGAAIVPGNAGASELMRRITDSHPATRMPPPESASRPLSPDEIDIIANWIDAGAIYERHWSYIPPDRSVVPMVERPHWATNSIDAFVLARLESIGLEPSPVSDRATLLRRVYLDLTGLPPTLAELDAFLDDESADAYERVVDRLLHDEPYITRMAEHFCSTWLDAARYADTIGIHTDNGRQTWLWRDWVLSALRHNMPYDRFVIEQLAGDLLTGATIDQKIASGFNRNHVLTDEGGALPEEYLVEYAFDRTETTASVFLGMTMTCARCHDHKYDPISQEDYYRLFAYFNSIDEPGLYTQTQDHNRAYEPLLEVPTPDQQASLASLEHEIGRLTKIMDAPLPGEQDQREAFISNAVALAGIDWSIPMLVSISSSDDRVTFLEQDDDSILATGPMPDFEDYTIQLRTNAEDTRLILLEALDTPGAETPGAGRAFHGNTVITHLTLATRPANSDAGWADHAIQWAWSDHDQQNQDYNIANIIDGDDDRGWAADGNKAAGRRVICLLTEEPIGASGETDVRIVIRFRSPFAQHSLGRMRFRFSPISESGVAALPPTFGRWYGVGPFRTDKGDQAFDTAFGPESLKKLDTTRNFGEGNQFLAFDASLVDDRIVQRAAGISTSYVVREVWSPDARTINVSIGSDDGFRLYVNGQEQAHNRVNRGCAPDQDRATLHLGPGRNLLALKIVNTGGPSGFYFRSLPVDGELSNALVAALIPDEARSEEHAMKLATAWRRTSFPAYREAERARENARAQVADIKASVPRTMVMQALPEPRPTHVLIRGQYDHPDVDRPVAPGIPASLGALEDEVPANRLGLAQWITSPDNPLASRVAVNRIWQSVFGSGLVETSEDFGLQGAWPSHPDLLDWLAVEFIESGWDVKHLTRLIVTSTTYQQSSRIRSDHQSIDPDNRLLARYPRRRMTAEQIRDQALFVSGLLIERTGGPSVKPYQPDGLWQEVAMVQSNTRTFERGPESELWRRSLYTYWKRASPPPSLQTFDAPTRESCVIRRETTNTPLQALVLWNDEQFVEAARVLAQRTLADTEDDASGISTMMRRCTARAPDEVETERLIAALHGFRARYSGNPKDAEALIAIGEAPVDDSIAPDELAAWTLIASAILNLHESITQD